MSEDSIWTRLAEAQAEMDQPVMDGVGHAGKNGSRSYPYATLGSVRRSVFPPLNKRGMFLTQHFDGDNILVTEVCMGSETVVLDRRMVPLTGRPQEDGSAETYAKRYALCSVFGLAGVEDDDGASTSGAAPAGGFVARCCSCGATYTFQDEAQMRSVRCCRNPVYERV